MTDQQIEQIAEAVFQKMLAKQEEWDQKQAVILVQQPASLYLLRSLRLALLKQTT